MINGAVLTSIEISNENESIYMQTLFISYCWEDGTPYAEDLENELSGKFDIRRDKSSLKCNDNIESFMRKIADCDNVVIVLTQKYLKSKNCMKEVAYLSKQPEWNSKCIILVVYKGIYDTDTQEKLLSYWKNKKISMEEKLKSACSKTICQEEYESISEVCDALETFLLEVKRRNNPSQIRIVNEIIRLSERNRSPEKETMLGMSKMFQEIIESKGNTTLSEIEKETGYSKEVVDRFIGKFSDLKIADIDSSGSIRPGTQKEKWDSYLKSIGKKSISDLSLVEYTELQKKLGNPF